MFNVLLAKVSAILLIAAIVIWLLRIFIEKKLIKNDGKISKLYNALKKAHPIIGKVLILTGLIHGLLSSEKLLSFNWGTACWVTAILLGAGSAFINGKNDALWKTIHRIIAAAAFSIMIVHVITA